MNICIISRLIFSNNNSYIIKKECKYPSSSSSSSISFDQPLAASAVGRRLDFDFNDAARLTDYKQTKVFIF